MPTFNSAVLDLVTKPLQCPSYVAVGDAVYIVDVDAVDQASAASMDTAKMLGFVISKPTAISCVVQVAGNCEAFTGLAAGDIYYLSDTPGAISLSPGTTTVVVGSPIDPATLVLTTVGTSSSGGGLGPYLGVSTIGALQTKGIGGGSVIGNARGLGAIDLQTTRLLATEVASGVFSTVNGGFGNTASGLYSTVSGGYGNTALSAESVIGGGSDNTASGGYSATVAGGNGNTAGAKSATVGGGTINMASDAYDTVGGGLRNNATGGTCTVGGGSNNIASGMSATVGGGIANHATGNYSTVGGGDQNVASSYYSTVGGGGVNMSSGYFSTIGGGESNYNSGLYGTIGGGQGNTASGSHGTVGGGHQNHASGDYSTASGGYESNATGNFSSVGGGSYNFASGIGSAVFGGICNNTTGATVDTTTGAFSGVPTPVAAAFGSFIGGGWQNQTTGMGSAICGGYLNTANKKYSAVNSGYENTASGQASSVGGGGLNTASNYYSTVAGGHGNQANGSHSTVSGGFDNTANGDFSVISGGDGNIASGKYSTVSGSRVLADKYAQLAHASGYFTIAGDAQFSTLIYRMSTTDATPTEMFLDGGTEASPGTHRAILATGSCWAAWVQVVATVSGEGSTAEFTRKCLITNASGTVALVGSVQTIGTDIGSNAGVPPIGWAVTVTADNTNKSLKIAVTGAAATNIQWVARVELTETIF